MSEPADLGAARPKEHQSLTGATDQPAQEVGRRSPDKAHKHLSSAGADWDFIADGAWWSRPLYQRAALLVLVAPLYRLRGYLYMAHQAASLRAPYFPYGPAGARARMAAQPKAIRSRLARWFTPPGWIHEYPCTDPWPHEHDEEHPGGDAHSALAHGICWEHELDIGYTAGDTFDLRFDRTYRLNFPDRAQSAQKPGEADTAGNVGKETVSASGALSEAPGGPGAPNIGPGAGQNERI